MRLVVGRLQNPVFALRWLLNEVVNQANAVAFLDRQGLMFAVGIKCDEGELGGFGGVGLDNDFAVRVADTEGSATIGGWKRQDQSPEHSSGLFGIPVCARKNPPRS